MQKLWTLPAVLAVTALTLFSHPVAAQRTQRALEDLRAAFGAETQISLDPDSGAARFVRLGSYDPELSLERRGDVRAAANAFLAEHADAFGVESRELAFVRQSYDSIGGESATYVQEVDGLKVFGAVLRLHWDAGGQLRAVNGTTFPGMRLDAVPTVPMERAENIAWASAVHKAGAAAHRLQVRELTLMALRAGAAAGRPTQDHLVYAIEIAGGGYGERMFVDAHSGKIVERHPTVHDTLTRRLYEANPGNLVWQEGDSTAGLSAPQTTLVDGAAAVYTFYSNISNGTHLSYDAQSAVMDMVLNPDVSMVGPNFCPNAQWNGESTVYCLEFADDETVGHEWTHGYTDYTHDLVYAFQSGALNESYSDVFGETIDQINGIGLDAPDVLRTDGECSLYSELFETAVEIVAPAALAGSYTAGDAEFGPSLIGAPPLNGMLVASVPADGCTAFTNPSEIAGKIALIQRGTCFFVEKTVNAEAAGAIGVVIVNMADDETFRMGNADPPVTVNIPAVMVGLTLGTQLLAEPADTVEVNLTSVVSGEDSTRWVLGEDGVPIRDMWTPSCLGHPDAIETASDDPTFGAYWCDKSGGDNGGVHFNSGVPNHAYALLVDGGTFGGETINGIGLTKAANIYWRAMSVYQMPLTQLADHADAIETSCADLIGTDVLDLEVMGPSGEVVSAADCDEVAAVMRAVQMRNSPDVLCAYEVVLQPDPPALCDTASPIYSDSFSADTGWVVSKSGMSPGFVDRDWVRVTDLPEPRVGYAFFAEDPFGEGFYCGQGPGDEACTNGTDDDGDLLVDWDDPDCDGVEDHTGVLSLVSPPIALPAGADNLVLVFDHYIATERDYDGGDLRISVNGGAFTRIEAASFIHNPYNTTLFTTDDPDNPNSNPMAGLEAFSGVDEGHLESSWGQSQISLDGLAASGDTIEIEFRAGTDVCVGFDGWYIDRVDMFACDNCPAVTNPDQLDADSDGAGDACDTCPTDPNKDAPGLCGCGLPDNDTVTDRDGDGTPDCYDACLVDPNKDAPGVCGCGVSDADTDSDGTEDCNDGCDADPDKTAPGVCGCGASDANDDGDTFVCDDLCPQDPNKGEPGGCGCGEDETGDTDLDGVFDCLDNCIDDPLKTEPGVCGCGAPDVDSDSDGTYNCDDECPLDPDKIVPGECDCHTPEGECDADTNEQPSGGCSAGSPSLLTTWLASLALALTLRRRRGRARPTV